MLINRQTMLKIAAIGNVKILVAAIFAMNFENAVISCGTADQLDIARELRIGPLIAGTRPGGLINNNLQGCGGCHIPSYRDNDPQVKQYDYYHGSMTGTAKAIAINRPIRACNLKKVSV